MSTEPAAQQVRLLLLPPEGSPHPSARPQRALRRSHAAVLVVGLAGHGGWVDPAVVGALQTTATMHSEHLSELERIATFRAGWDDEGAPAPSSHAVAEARSALTDLLVAGLPPAEIDADVNGGIALSLFAQAAGRSVWVACPNEGRAHAVLHGDPERRARSVPISGTGWIREVREFLEAT